VAALVSGAVRQPSTGRATSTRATALERARGWFGGRPRGRRVAGVCESEERGPHRNRLALSDLELRDDAIPRGRDLVRRLVGLDLDHALSGPHDVTRSDPPLHDGRLDDALAETRQVQHLFGHAADLAGRSTNREGPWEGASRSTAPWDRRLDPVFGLRLCRLVAIRPPAPPGPSSSVPPIGEGLRFPDPSAALALYEALARTRRFDQRTGELYRLGDIVGGCYTGIGNEATSVGMAWPMAPGDVLVPTHRDLGAHFVRGHTLLDVARQYLKRETAQTRGRDSGLHLGQEGSDIVGMISHLAHMMPVAAGIAWAERRQGRATCVVTTVGDGSTSLGDFHETLNFASLHRLPIVFVIVNNQYAYATPTTLQYATPELSARAAGYGMAGQTVDGTDVVAVLRAVEAALARGRSGEGPTLLEARTMRMRGHSEHDDFSYVPPELIEAWSAWDPLKRFAAALVERGIATELELASAEETIVREVAEAFDAARSEPSPAPEGAQEGVFRRWSPEDIQHLTTVNLNLYHCSRAPQR